MFDALLTDFSKTLNNLDHKLLTAKLSLIHGYYKFLADLLFIISNIDIAGYAHDVSHILLLITLILSNY